MPTPREPNLTDRLLEFGSGKLSRRERALLAEARPPRWVRYVFGFAFGAIILSILIAVAREWLNLPVGPRVWPTWSVFVVLMPVVEFARREVFRRYGRRAQRGQRDWQ